jgi:hypothetical protein
MINITVPDEKNIYFVLQGRVKDFDGLNITVDHLELKLSE